MHHLLSIHFTSSRIPDICIMSVRIQLQSRSTLAPHISFKQSDKPIDESQFISGIKIKPTGRFDLNTGDELRLIDRFIALFKANVRSKCAAALKLDPNAHYTDVRYA